MNDCVQPYISIIIPTCHRNDLLAKCLDCLAPGIQTLQPERYEVIVTDDGSRSTAEAIVRESYPWVRWMVGPRKGPAANRNNGARLAQGDWLVFTDDDCLPASDWLRAFTSAIQHDTQVYEGKTTCEAGIHSPLEHAPINLSGGWLWSCNMMVRKTVFSDMEGFYEGFPYPHMEDADFRERLRERNLQFVFVSDASVDHPPRRVAWGQHMGATHESGVLFWYKHGHSGRFRYKLMLDIVRNRMLRILKSPFSSDTLIALLSFCIECVYVAAKINLWEQKYRLQFDKTS